MSKAIVIREYGGPEVLREEQIEIDEPDINEIFIRQTAIGVHYHDIYVRSGLYKTLNLPGVPGVEATGVVEKLGSNVSRFNIGDRVAYVSSEYGAYASHRRLNQIKAIKLSDSISDELIATNFSRALTVIMLARKVTNLNSSHRILVTAAAGGVGRLLCQWADTVGACVVGSVSSLGNADLAKSYGCKHTLVYDQDDFLDRVKEITNGEGFDIVYDSVGIDTFPVSLKVTAKRGHLVNFGQSSGAVDPVLMQSLANRSLTLTRPILFHYIEDENSYENLAEAAFEFLKSPSLKLPTPKSYCLKEASIAHSILESRAGGGSLYLQP